SLEETHYIVAEVADRAAAEARQPGHRCRPVAAQFGPQYVQNVAVIRTARFALLRRGNLAVRATRAGNGLTMQLNAPVDADADERVAADLLAALDRFQQEGCARLLHQLQIDGDGRLQVGGEFARHRDKIGRP